MDILNNWDLFSVGLAVAGSFILGFTVYYNKRDSLTNLTFLLFTIVTGLWGIVNYLQYQFTSETLTLWVIRLAMGLAVWQAYLIFQFFYVYPKDKVEFPAWYRFFLLPLTFATWFITLTPILYSGIIGQIRNGELTKIEQGPGIIIFGLVAVGLVVSGICLFVIKTIKYKKYDVETRPASFILLGTFLMFLLIITFNFVFPNLLLNVKMAPLGALFILPFIITVSYALSKSRLMNPKVLGISVLAFFLTVATFFEIIFSQQLIATIFRLSIFLLVLAVSILLVRGMVREIKQREKIEKLAWDLERANNEMEIANEKLKELDKQKTEFVSIASHQLRSPLTAIKGYSSMVLEGSFGKVPEKARGAIDVVFQSSQKLVSVIEDFLNVTRIELGRMKYEWSDFDLGNLAKQVTEEQRAGIEKRGLKLSFEDLGGDHNIFADTGKVNQVLNNIIDNASKYTKKGFIKVFVENATGADGKEIVRFKTIDSGVGIDAETMPKLFEKFVRAYDAGKSNIIGTGLGLYVAKQIIEGLGGTIHAESPGKGKGSTFIVEFKHCKVGESRSPSENPNANENVKSAYSPELSNSGQKPSTA